jgi:AcrR family transcriptional regulator
MSRPADEERPQELLDAIVRYLVHHGLSGLSLRPLAKAVGSSPRGLLYHFGSKEKLVVGVLAELRRRQQNAYGSDAPTFAEACRKIWRQMSSPKSEPLFRLFFEAYGIALRNPRLYAEFLHHTIEDWLSLIAEPLVQEGYKPSDARAFATVVLAGMRGFMLDYCTTKDRARLDRAVNLWLGKLDSMLPTKGMN